MKTLQLTKSLNSAQSKARYLYQIYEGADKLCERSSNRNYVACQVHEIRDTDGEFIKYETNFFASVQRLYGHRGRVPYGMAYLANEKPVQL